MAKSPQQTGETITRHSSQSVWKRLRNRVIAGLFVALPVFITILVIVWIYETFIRRIVGSIAKLLVDVWYPGAAQDAAIPFWVEYILAPLAAVFVVLGFLFICGMFFRSRLHRLMDWTFSNVPGVRTIYSAVSNVFDAIQKTQGEEREFKRVVLVEFPHPGMKAPAFVTSECIDIDTREKILSIYVPTTPIPTSGYMLLVPEHEVTPLNWDLQETLQAIVSGGITVPPTVRYGSKSPNINRMLASNEPTAGNADSQKQNE